MKLRCPHCGGPVYLQVAEPSDTEAYIFSCLLQYLTGGPQTFDGYIKPVPDKRGMWEFYIKTFDSPEGDSWAKGVIEWRPGMEYKVTWDRG